MSALNPLLAALEGSPEVRPGTGPALAAARDAEVLLAAAAEMERRFAITSDDDRVSKVAVLSFLRMRAAGTATAFGPEEQSTAPAADRVQCWHTEPGTPCDWNVCRQPEGGNR